MAYPNDETTPATERAREVATSAQSEAQAVAETAKDSGGHVLDTAKQEAGQVVDEAKFQGRRLLDESLNEVRAQAGTGQHLVAELARSLSGELQSMSSAGNTDGMLSDYVGRAQRFTDEAATWLDSRQPEEVLDSVRRYAARNPWQFLAISAGVGFLGARLVRGLKGAASDEEQGRARLGYEGAYDRPLATPGAPVMDPGYITTPDAVRPDSHTSGDYGLVDEPWIGSDDSAGRRGEWAEDQR